jgi:hypothetical protein
MTPFAMVGAMTDMSTLSESTKPTSVNSVVCGCEDMVGRSLPDRNRNTCARRRDKSVSDRELMVIKFGLPQELFHQVSRGKSD